MSIAQQRRKFRRGAGEGVRTAQEHQKHRLDEIGMVWDPYWERWWEKYQVAKTYYQAHGHLNLPVNYVTEEGVKLGMWLSSQRQAMRGNPNFLMTPGAEGAVGSDWNALDPPADESECPAAAIISELLPRKKPAVKLDRRFFLWMHLAFPCKCQRMCLDKSVSK